MQLGVLFGIDTDCGLKNPMDICLLGTCQWLTAAINVVQPPIRKYLQDYFKVSYLIIKFTPIIPDWSIDTIATSGNFVNSEVFKVLLNLHLVCVYFSTVRGFSPESVLQHESPVEEFLRRRHIAVKTGSKARSIHYLVLFVLAAIRLMLKTLLEWVYDCFWFEDDVECTSDIRAPGLCQTQACRCSWQERKTYPRMKRRLATRMMTARGTSMATGSSGWLAGNQCASDVAQPASLMSHRDNVRCATASQCHTHQ